MRLGGLSDDICNRLDSEITMVTTYSRTKIGVDCIIDMAASFNVVAFGLCGRCSMIESLCRTVDSVYCTICLPLVDGKRRNVRRI
jgi:hypothetical protein